MVHLWISIVNDKLNHICDHKKILKIFNEETTYFYGDYNLDIFMLSKNEWKNADLNKVVERVLDEDINTLKDESYTTLGEIVQKFGQISEKNLKRMFPKKENMNVNKSFTIRNDGNFYTIACETERFYYVFCFVSS